jgi:hypothetical protein
MPGRIFAVEAMAMGLLAGGAVDVHGRVVPLFNICLEAAYR